MRGSGIITAKTTEEVIMARIIRWKHANGKIVEYKDVQALADALGAAVSTTYKYLREGIYSDTDLPVIRRSQKARNTRITISKRRWSESLDKHYLDFIEEMETWESRESE
jgi:hypothetical protein